MSINGVPHDDSTAMLVRYEKARTLDRKKTLYEFVRVEYREQAKLTARISRETVIMVETSKRT